MRKNGMALLQSFTEGPVLFAPEQIGALRSLAEAYTDSRGASMIQSALASFGLGAARSRDDVVAADNDMLCAAYGLSGTSDRSKPFAFANGLAVIPVWGSLLHRDNYCDSYATGYDYIRSRFAAAVADPDVEGIVLDVNSPGGHVRGNFELSDMIYESRAVKPSLAVVDGMAYSGGYSLGSSASRMVVIPSAGVGSIGVVMMHASVEGFLAKHGVEITFIHAGKHKVDGNAFQNLPEDVRERFQARIDASYDKFVSTVARNRGLEADAVRDTQALCFNADDALSRGLIDAVQMPSAALAAFRQELDGSNTNHQGATKMNHDNPQGGDGAAPDAAAAAASTDTTATSAAVAAPAAAEAPAPDAAADERARIKGITTCDEAKGRETLAAHFAYDTTMSVDDARKALAAAPVATASTSPFAAAMASTPNPEVGAGGEGGAGEQSVSDRILGNYAQATGVKIDKK
jgi:signal peptide peptidase SppA